MNQLRALNDVPRAITEPWIVCSRIMKDKTRVGRPPKWCDVEITLNSGSGTDRAAGL